MGNLQTPFRYEYVGSFLRPEWLKTARRQFDEGTIPSPAQFLAQFTMPFNRKETVKYYSDNEGNCARGLGRIPFLRRVLIA